MNPHESKRWARKGSLSANGAIPMPPARNPSQVAQAATAAMQQPQRRTSGGAAEIAWEHRRRASQASAGSSGSMGKSP